MELNKNEIEYIMLVLNAFLFPDVNNLANKSKRFKDLGLIDLIKTYDKLRIYLEDSGFQVYEYYTPDSDIETWSKEVIDKFRIYYKKLSDDFIANMK